MRCLCMCVCVSVCLSVCLSRSYILWKRINISSKFYYRRVYSHTILVFCTKPYGDIPTGTPPPPLTGASNAGEVGRNRDSEPISGFNVCCQRCYRPGVINTVPPDGGKLWHLSLVVRGAVCWWRETTTKCLWQEVSTLRQIQQNII